MDFVGHTEKREIKLANGYKKGINQILMIRILYIIKYVLFLQANQMIFLLLRTLFISK